MCNVTQHVECRARVVDRYHVASPEYPVEFQVLVRLEEGLGAGCFTFTFTFTPLAVERLSGRPCEILQAFPLELLDPVQCSLGCADEIELQESTSIGWISITKCSLS